MNGKSSHSINTVFVLLVFCLFAVCSLFLVLIGANVYRGIVGNMDSNNETRASLSYVSNKVHAADGKDVELQTINGRQTLVISAQYNGKDYHTYIYEFNGSLMELFTKADNAFTPGSGDKITPVSEFTMTKSGSELNLAASGKNHRRLTMNLSLS
jgi:hypothetical protein